ncbi:MAG: hypothetical protein V7647_3751 [Acidobacteriota bacterium]
MRGIVARAERKRHRALDDNVAVDAGYAAEEPHPAAQPPDVRFDDDDVAGVDGAAIPDPLDPCKVDELFPVLRLREDHDRADLRDGLRQDRRRQHGDLPGTMREVPLVQRDVLDPDDPLVRLEFRDAIDEEKRVAVRQDPLDRAVVEGEGEIHAGCQSAKVPRCQSARVRPGRDNGEV